MRVRNPKLLVLCAAMGLAIIAPLLASGNHADVAMLKKKTRKAIRKTFKKQINKHGPRVARHLLTRRSVIGDDQHPRSRTGSSMVNVAPQPIPSL